MGSIAKAITAFVLALVVGFLTDRGIVLEHQNELSALIEALVTGGLVWLVPNQPYPTNRNRPV